MALTFSHSSKYVNVPQVDAQPLLMQSLINAIRDEEASERGIVEAQIADAAGKDDLGGGVMTGITVALRSTWKLNFASGAYQASLDGGNLADALARINNTGSPQVLVLASAAATVISSTGSTPPTAAAIASAVRSELETGSPVPVDVQQMNSAEVIGDGTEGNPWRGVGVSP